VVSTTLSQKMVAATAIERCSKIYLTSVATRRTRILLLLATLGVPCAEAKYVGPIDGTLHDGNIAFFVRSMPEVDPEYESPPGPNATKVRSSQAHRHALMVYRAKTLT
jgi:hypothetical protein